MKTAFFRLFCALLTALSADGEKLFVQENPVSGVATGTEYAANYRIENGTLTMIHTEAGYYTSTMSNPALGMGPSYKHVWYLKDHLGNNRIVASQTGAVMDVHDYDPFGAEIDALNTGAMNIFLFVGANSPYKYGGKEWNEATSTYDFEARQFSPTFHRFTTMDPLAEKYYGISPYAYCANDPVNYVDPQGRRPIYSTSGYLIGTDGFGLLGDAIIMDEQYYYPKITSDEALRYDLGIQGLINAEAFSRFQDSFENLSSRPDWDGYLTLAEANDWFRNGNGQPLYVALDKIDLSGVVSLGEHFVGQVKVISLFLSSNSVNDALVFGQITLKRYPNHTVRAYSDTYNFDMKSWRNISQWPRNIETAIGKKVAGDGTPYEINFYGSKSLTPILPWLK